MERKTFFTQLGVSPATFFLYVGRGVFPPPPRYPGSRLIRYTQRYLRTCRAHIHKRRQVTRRLKVLQDWVNFGGKPYLTAAGAERIRPLFRRQGGTPHVSD